MGEVYRATDTDLKRQVAIKVLPTSVAADSDRLERFQREAEVLAALNHPNIAHIHGLEKSDGTIALVMELVEGPTLADRIAQGAIPIEAALRIAKQIAEALEAAHEQGIVHRDLKPANIKVRPDGTVKVLDFGLAKTVESDLSRDLSNSPTVAATRVGTIVGTAAYMSPEQTRGRTIDKRTDVWAFGCVQYEMLTGRRAFDGGTIADTIGAVLGREPDWATLPAATPARVEWLVRRCLEKDPKRRLHDVADARIELDEALSHSPESGQVALADHSLLVVRRWPRKRVAWVTGGACLLALIVDLVFGRAGFFGQPAGDARVYRSSIVLPEGLRLAGPAAGRFSLSPDGRRLAIVASNAGERSMLWLRPMDTLVAQPLVGTEGATFPFWSPDSRFVAFLAQGKLKKIDVAGGPPATLCDAAFGATGAWNKDDVLLFTPTGLSPLHRVSASGGTSSPVTTLDAAIEYSQHVSPVFLPDGQHFLYLVRGSTSGGVFDPRGVYVGSLDPRQPSKQLLQSGSNAKYAQGQVLFLRDNTLMAQALDLVHLEMRGEALSIVEKTQGGEGVTGAAGAFTVSDTGVIAYQTAPGRVRTQLVWFDRAGKQMAALGDRGDYGDVSLSPDRTRAAVSLVDPERGTSDLWIYDVARGVRDRFTFDPGDEFAPSWSPDGGRLVFSTRRTASIDLHSKASDGVGREDVLLEAGLGKFQASWSPDSRFLVYVGGGSGISRSGLWILPLAGDRKSFPFLGTPLIETHGQFSPDGRWIAYAAGQQVGQFDPRQLAVYVTPFPGPGPKVRVSTADGGWPRWRRDGKEIFYVTADNILTAAAVTSQASGFEVGAVRPLFPARPRPMARLDAYSYDVSSDGQRFLVNTLVEDATSTAVTLVVNWTTGFKK